MSRKERRNYLRISTVLPVEFFLAGENGKKITPWLQGFTCDIGKGGICLTVNDLWWGFWDKFNQPGNKIFLRIKLPFKKEPLFLKANIKWLNTKKLKKFYQHKIGLEFIKTSQNKPGSIFKFALTKKITPIVVAGAILVSFLISGVLFWQQRQLLYENKKLANRHLEILERNSYLTRAFKESRQAEEFFWERKQQLTERTESLQVVIAGLESEYQGLKSIHTKDKKELEELSRKENEILRLKQELKSLENQNKFLAEKIAAEEKVKRQVKEEAQELVFAEQLISQEVISSMYDWIKHRQDLNRGLVLSYEGDEKMGQVCFTYDQALSVFVFLNFQEKEKGAKILDFYLKEIKQGRSIYNGYFTDGSVFEYVVHSGPKAWLGLAALAYIQESGDKRYLKIAEHVGTFLAQMQDEEGGVVGGPKVKWYSTEHNVDSYAFFRLFYELTKNEQYKEKALLVKDWLTRYAYTDHKIPVKRGKGDATIATDTYAWSVTSLGPETLYSLGMDPELILEFAEKKCRVKVEFKHPGKKRVEIEGFDFAKARNVGRGGVVSGEWTAQMALAYRVMADYFKEKDSQKFKDYLEKANFYFNQLKKMVIVSPSRAGRKDLSLPYASASFVDTGHGWRTPRGDRTGSLASTAYFLIAYKGYNPLRLEKLNVSLGKIRERGIYESKRTFSNN